MSVSADRLVATVLLTFSGVLSAAAQSPEIRPLAQLKDFPDWVTSLAISPDGQSLAAGSKEVVRLCPLRDPKECRTLTVKPGFVRALAWSPDGRLLATGTYQSVQLWEPESGAMQRQLKGHRSYVTGAAFSPDGRFLATSSEDETARIWDLSTGDAKVLTGHEYPVQGIAWSADGKYLATAAGDETRITRPGQVKLWDAATGKELHDLPPPKKAATGVAFSRDSRFLCSTGLDERVNVYEVATGKALGFFGGHKRPTNCVVFAPDGETVISGSGGRFVGGHEVKIWNRADGDVKATLEEHEAQISALALSPDGTILATGSYDKTVSLWDVSAVLGTNSSVEPSDATKPSNLQTGAATTSLPCLRRGGEHGLWSVVRGPRHVTTDNGQRTKNSLLAMNDAPAANAQAADGDSSKREVMKIGIIGLDTSHAVAFTKVLNDPKAAEDVAGCRIVAAYPKGSPDIESSVSRVPGYTEEVRKQGVEIVDSIDELLRRVDYVLLETNDGRPHFEQALPVLKARKPVFIDKPVAGSLADAVAIFDAAKKYETPVFSSSSLRFAPGAQALRAGKIGKVLGCDAYSPCSLESTHPDLFWYGIHGVESLFTVMGTGCQSVMRAGTRDFDVVTGTWDEGRIGTFRGLRKGTNGYGGTAFGEKGIEQIGPFGGYRPLVVEIVKFFKTGQPPVSPRETLEIYAFMAAADESQRQGGCPVTLDSVMDKARETAKQRLGD